MDSPSSHAFTDSNEIPMTFLILIVKGENNLDGSKSGMTFLKKFLPEISILQVTIPHASTNKISGSPD